MDPIPAFSLLLGVYSGIMYGGSITAVLIRTPGKPAAVVTTLDGYPMAQQGRAIEALTASCWASFFGGAIGFVVLFLSAQPIARFALRFGPAEYFAVGLFGLSVVTLLSTDNVKKGRHRRVPGVHDVYHRDGSCRRTCKIYLGFQVYDGRP